MNVSDSGASSGIGKGAALLFAKNKYQLSLTGRNSDSLKEVAALCVSDGGLSPDDVSLLVSSRYNYHSDSDNFGRVEFR